MKTRTAALWAVLGVVYAPIVGAAGAPLPPGLIDISDPRIPAEWGWKANTEVAESWELNRSFSRESAMKDMAWWAKDRLKMSAEELFRRLGSTGRAHFNCLAWSLAAEAQRVAILNHLPGGTWWKALEATPTPEGEIFHLDIDIMRKVEAKQLEQKNRWCEKAKKDHDDNDDHRPPASPTFGASLAALMEFGPNGSDDEGALNKRLQAIDAVLAKAGIDMADARDPAQRRAILEAQIIPSGLRTSWTVFRLGVNYMYRLQIKDRIAMWQRIPPEDRNRLLTLMALVLTAGSAAPLPGQVPITP